MEDGAGRPGRLERRGPRRRGVLDDEDAPSRDRRALDPLLQPADVGRVGKHVSFSPLLEQFRGPVLPRGDHRQAVGHGLEGDFNRKGTSAYAGRIGQQVASPLCTVIDDATVANDRGALSFDDEGVEFADDGDGLFIGRLLLRRGD